MFNKQLDDTQLASQASYVQCSIAFFSRRVYEGVAFEQIFDYMNVSFFAC
jgi:hypothetical protein